jgi:predicted Fe-Mo cluster-binding NifX family protein
MKVAVAAQGKDLKSLIDPHFGRARYLIVVDSKSGEFTVHDNAKNADAAHGAGIQAAGTVIDSDARAVITGNIGPKAFATLKADDVTVYLEMSGTVEDAMGKFKTGQLEPTFDANVEEHSLQRPK